MVRANRWCVCELMRTSSALSELHANAVDLRGCSAQFRI
jgi:hypothetical protein